MSTSKLPFKTLLTTPKTTSNIINKVNENSIKKETTNENLTKSIKSSINLKKGVVSPTASETKSKMSKVLGNLNKTVTAKLN
jgi:hypothetical protein